MDIMADFSVLSLNEIDMPEIPDLPSILFQNINENNIMESETIEILLINIYSYEDSNITFDELLQKLIEFYFNEATNIMIYNHLNIIYQSLFLYETYDNINMVMIEFISSSYGTEYLKDIYNMNCYINF